MLRILVEPDRLAAVLDPATAKETPSSSEGSAEDCEIMELENDFREAQMWHTEVTREMESLVTKSKSWNGRTNWNSWQEGLLSKSDRNMRIGSTARTNGWECLTTRPPSRAIETEPR